MFMIILVLAVLALYVAWYYWWVRRYPSGPTPLPVVGNLLQIPRENFHLYIRELTKIHGPVFTIFTPLPAVILGDYEALKEALIVKADCFSGRVKTPPDNFVCSNYFDKHGGGIIGNDGDNWRVQRRVALTIFRNFGMGKGLVEPMIMGPVTEMCKYLDGLEDKSGVNMCDPLVLCVGNVINKLIFGYSYRHNDSSKLYNVVELLTPFVQCFRTPETLLVEAWPWTRYVPAVQKAIKRVKDSIDSYFEFIDNEVKALERTFDKMITPTNFVHAYMKEMEQNHGLSRNHLVVVASDFWMAGMETTATSLRWGVMFMMQWPDVQAKMQAEIDEVIGRDRFSTLADKPRLPYANAVLLEVQRYSNIISVAIPHRCTTDATVSGHNVPADTTLYAMYFSVLRDDPAWGDPENFRPERYLHDDGVTFRKELLERTVPFGIGKRLCAGESLARSQMFLIWTTLFQRYKFIANGPVDMEANFGLILQPTDHHGRIVPRF